MPIKKSKTLTPILLMAAGAILIMGVIAWYVASTGAVTRQPPVVAGDVPFPDIPRVNVKDAKAAFDIGNAIFIDTRDAESFFEGHIPGAILITEYDVLNRLDELDPEAWIIAYCT